MEALAIEEHQMFPEVKWAVKRVEQRASRKDKGGLGIRAGVVAPRGGAGGVSPGQVTKACL